MPKYKLLVMTQPVEGREGEYNEWYDNVHLHDLVACDGIKSAQRFRLNQVIAPQGGASLPYLAIYEIETDDVNKAIAQIGERSQSGKMSISPALSVETTFGAVYEELGPAVTE
jgi:2-polyprenyl-6-methoxyphenol hydroxylase-like FAD-dependent oxidoreductase